MMDYDKYSARGYMELSDGAEGSDKALFPFPSNVVDWMELFNDSTNAYDYALTELVMDDLAFAWPEEGGKDVEWRCVAYV